MAPPAFIFAVVASRYIFDPAHAAVPTGVVLTTPEALTELRIVGAIALTVSLTIGACLFSRDRLRWGHAVVAALLSSVLAVRFYGFAVDGTTLAMGRQLLYVVVELVVLPLNVMGFLVDRRRGSLEAPVGRA